MPTTASDEKHLYEFSFAWHSPYGHAVKLLEKLAPPGLVVDLGAGAGAIAEPLLERGYEYAGVDNNDAAVTSLTHRGLEAHKVDLAEADLMAARLRDVVRGRRTTAVLMLDVIEHLPNTRRFLRAARDAVGELGGPLLLVSVPNVAHLDIAAKLVFGRWEYTPTGLLDQTHLQLFTAARLNAELRASGFLEVEQHDFQLWHSDQHFPPQHPALAPKSPVAQLLCGLRELADPHARTVQFVRAFAAGHEVEPKLEPASIATEQLFATVVVRTQGTRMLQLREALTCLAAQTRDDFDVLLTLHADDAEHLLPTMTALVEEFDASFATRVEVVPVSGGGRARPLNLALERVRGSYVVFLDDDDLVTADWIEAFEEHARDGAVVRSVGAVRQISVPRPDHAAPYVVDSGLEFPYRPKFDFLFHFWGNETPICTFAVPRQLIDLGVRFDERLAVLEDWDFLLQCIALTSVRDTERVTSIYQMWQTGVSSASAHHADVWLATQRLVQEKSDERPLLLPARLASEIIRAVQSERELPMVREELARERGELAYFRDEYFKTIGSLRWRVLGGPARLVAAARRLVRGTR